MEQEWWEAFDSSLYINIETNQQILDDWATDIKATKRIKPITGPAGAGKSWFLKAAKLRWHEFPDRLVFELDVPELVNKDIKSGTIKDVLNERTVRKQLEEYAHLALQKGCPSWRYDENLELSRNIEIFSSLLAAFSTKNSISVFILVDGYDEVEEEQSIVVATRILDIFARQRNCRIVLCRRDSHHKLSGQLREFEDYKNGILIGAINSPELQLQRFKDHPKVQSQTTEHLTFSEFKGSLAFYQWNNAFINIYLFAFAHEKQSRRRPGLFDPSDIEDCIKALIQRPFGASVRFGPIKPEEFRLMQDIAVKLDDKWTEIDLNAQLQIRLTDQRIESLFRFGVLQTDTKPTIKRKIADGLRELLRDLNKFED